MSAPAPIEMALRNTAPIAGDVRAMLSAMASNATPTQYLVLHGLITKAAELHAGIESLMQAIAAERAS